MAYDPDQPRRIEIMARPADNTSSAAQYRHLTYTEVTGTSGELKHALDVQLFGSVNVSITGVATESTLVQVLSGINSISSVDFALQTTLADVLSAVQSISSVGFATESTLAQVLTELSTVASAVTAGVMQTNLYVEDSAVSASNPVPVEGDGAEGSALGNPVPVAFKNFLTTFKVTPHVLPSAGVNLQLNQLFDGGFNTPDYSSNGEYHCLGASTDGTKANATYPRVDSSDALHSVGNVAHDSTDTSNPVKIGGYAHDYTPDSVGEQGRTAVSEGNRVDLAMNLRGQIIEGVNAAYHTLTSVNTTFETTTAVTSNAIDISNYRMAAIQWDSTVTGTPTDIRYEVWSSFDGTSYAKIPNGFLGAWIYDDVGGASLTSSPLFAIAGQSLYLVVFPNGVSSASSFGLTNVGIYLRN